MTAQKPQTFANHVRFDPLFHFFVAPVFLGSAVAALVLFVMHPGFRSGWLFVAAVAAITAVFKARLYALKVQDRVIRIEERQRLGRLLPEPLRPRIGELTESQLVALRFAPDEELAGLTERAFGETLSRNDIKKSIRNWRADEWRV